MSGSEQPMGGVGFPRVRPPSARQGGRSAEGPHSGQVRLPWHGTTASPSGARSAVDLMRERPKGTGPAGTDSAVVPAVEAHGLRPRGAAGWQRRLVRLLMGLDALAAGTASSTAMFVRFLDDQTLFYLVTTALFPILWLLTCASTRSYELRF